MDNVHKFLLFLCWTSFVLTTWSLTSLRQQFNFHLPVPAKAKPKTVQEHHKAIQIVTTSMSFNQTISPQRTPCEPHHKVVYIKTHKTGSTTLGSIIDRYAFSRNLTVLVPKRGTFINYMSIFSARKIAPVNGNSEQNWSLDVGYDVLTNHARLSKKEMDVVFHGAKYVTIIREPAAQWQSAFSYFEIWRSMPKSREPMKLFLSQPERFFDRVMRMRQYFKQSMHNQQLFDFGMKHQDMSDEDKVKRKIEELDSDFDLVMITEYFDESLLLLRKLLCWTMDDVVYLTHAVRSAALRKKDDDSLAEKIREWNKADVMLYNHFNETFWQKVREYGATFSEDLTKLKKMLLRTSTDCFNKSRVKKIDRRSETFPLNEDAPKICVQLVMGDSAYTSLFSKRLKDRNIPCYDNTGILN